MSGEITAEEFEDLYRAVAPDLFAYVRRRTDADAEGLVAEVFVIAWRRRASLRDSQMRRAWLFGIARTLLLADRRTRDAERTAWADLALVEPEASGDTCVEAVVARAVSRLGARDREVIELVEWERLTPTEAAVVLGIRAGAARVRLHRARQALASDAELNEVVEQRSAHRA